ncbi:hypothetical protein BRADI_4g12945v3 [Brachypodium distachyon]|uniref:Uncharacterized protein n=1 Tax=Brachypodium distachyon TaxID=15368 RepID=A0A2K2CMG0_BRADI|nr:hypothetical protein BRADI_4g12945v3 [Brachypodium distachyon]
MVARAALGRSRHRCRQPRASPAAARAWIFHRMTTSSPPSPWTVFLEMSTVTTCTCACLRYKCHQYLSGESNLFC